MDNALITAILGREQLTVSADALKLLIDRTILVTGGGGSIGSELVRILSTLPCHIVLFDRSENNLARMLLDLKGSKAVYTAVLGSIENEYALDHAFRLHHPNIVLHTAAYKHLPLLETNPLQAMSNNVFGTLRVKLTASLHGAEAFVLVSTDKAVNPSSVMGATKRAAEMVVHADNGYTHNMRAMVVRLGNVLGSSGSVVPIFERQIAAGGPVTVTHPDATRFFMSIPEAAGLILHAALMGGGGETFVLNMGEPIKIADVARKMIRHERMHHFERTTNWTHELEIEFTGLRPGEKLTEQLYDGEVEDTPHPRIWKAKLAASMPVTEMEKHLCSMQWAIQQGRADKALEALCALVPEYAPGTGAAKSWPVGI